MEEPKGADGEAAAQRHHQHDGVAARAIAMISLPAVGTVRARGAGRSSPRRHPRRRDALLASARRYVVGGAERLVRAKCCHETPSASRLAREGRDGTSRSHGVSERPGGVPRNGDLVPYPDEGDVLPDAGSVVRRSTRPARPTNFLGAIVRWGDIPPCATTDPQQEPGGTRAPWTPRPTAGRCERPIGTASATPEKPKRRSARWCVPATG